MEIRGKGVCYGCVRQIAEDVSRELYGGNVRVHPDSKPLGSESYGFRGRIMVVDSRGPGARTSWSGRHGPYACWHAYRDVLARIFETYPNARVRTSMAHYVGAAGFEETYPATADRNIGSQFAPAYMPDLCECDR